MANSSRIERLNRHVLAGGGVWVGVQEGVPPTPNLVLFNSPTTGTTLALPDTPDFNASTVHAKIEASDKAFGKGRYIKVPRATAEIFLQDMKGIVTKFETLLRGEQE